ncbi:MAG: type I restriction enzyme endonuclease domain-containing protein [Bifidobacterium pseudocatenulatum]
MGYGRTSVVKSQKFSEMLQNTLNAYLNGMLTNAQVIEELVNMAKEIMKDRDDAQKLGLSDEEMAFYDAITQPQAVKDFYDNDQLVSIARELTDAMRATPRSTGRRRKRQGRHAACHQTLCCANTSIRPKLKEDAMKTVMEQCELWADTKISE